MERNISMEEISDGKLYTANDMVKAGCGDCKGCSDCCRGMGSSIILDPLDIVRLTEGNGKNFTQLLSEGYIELNAVEGIILPNIKMEPDCKFLNEQGRCDIHAYRPGICRLFPLGRIYEDGSYKYFLQVHECSNKNRTKVKVKSWINVPEFGKYEQFVGDWHYFLKDVSVYLQKADSEVARKISMYLLNTFYITEYAGEKEFYQQFYERLDKIKSTL